MSTTSKEVIDALLQQRYGGNALSSDLPVANTTIASQLAHHSVRNYLATPLAAGTLELLIAAAQSASTSSNLQLWSVVAVQDAERKARLSKLAGDQAHIRKAPLFLVFLADLALAKALAARAQVALDGLDYLETFLVGVIDATLAAQNVALAAESLGLGTVYIGGIRNQPEQVAAELGLPAQTFAVFGLVIGHPDPASTETIKPRLPQAAILHREQYNAAPQAAAIAEYDAILQEFQAAQGMPIRPWSELILRRLGSGSALSGRDRLGEAVGNLGFKIDA